MTGAEKTPGQTGAETPVHSSPVQVDVFAPFAAAPGGRPFVVAQLGLSLDGRIATETGESRGINGDAALDHLHRIRANVDAVVVGAGTIAADDPQLNVRRARGRNPARVVIDPSGRLGGDGKWLARDGAKLLLVSAAGRAPHGAELIRLPAEDGVISPRAIIDAGCVDRLHLLVAPVIIGSGKSGLDLAPIARLDQALRPRTDIHVLAGGEVVFDCDLRAAARQA